MSQVDWRKPLILVFVLCALGGAAYWLEFKQKPKKEAIEEGSKKIFTLKDTPIHSIRIEGGISSKSITLSCTDFEAKQCKPGDNSKWKVTKPTQLRADDSNANALVSALNHLTVNETIDLKEEVPEKKSALLKDYGLDPQSREKDSTKRIFVQTQSGDTVLYLGQTHPIGETIFAAVEKIEAGQKPSGKIDENKIYLIPSYFKSNFEHDLSYWRDKKLLTLSAHEISSFKFDGPKGKFTAEKRNGEWKIQSESEEYLGDIENVDNLLTGATFLNAKNFVSESKTDSKARTTLQGIPPIIKLTLQKEASAPVVLTLYQKPPLEKGGAPPKLYAAVSNLDPLFELESFSKDRLNKSARDLRLTKLITSMDRFTAKRLEFVGKPIGASPLILKNAEGKWMAQPSQTEINQDRVTSLLDKLSGNRIKDFLKGSAVPTGEQEGLKLVLGDEKTDGKRQILFWKNNGKLYARDLLSSTKEVFLVDEAIQDHFPWDSGFFKKTDPHPSGTVTPKAG